MEASSVQKRYNHKGGYGRESMKNQIINVCITEQNGFYEDSGSEYDEDQFADVDEDVLISKSNKKCRNSGKLDNSLIANNQLTTNETQKECIKPTNKHSLKRKDGMESYQKPKSPDRIESSKLGKFSKKSGSIKASRSHLNEHESNKSTVMPSVDNSKQKRSFALISDHLNLINHIIITNR